MFSCEFFFSNFVLSRIGFTKIVKSKLMFLTYNEVNRIQKYKHICKYTKYLSLLGLLLVKIQNKWILVNF